MKCPKCGYPEAKYDISRRILWGDHRSESSLTRKTETRTNFNAHCPKCGHKWNDTPEDYAPEVTSKEEDQTELEETEIDAEDDEE